MGASVILVLDDSYAVRTLIAKRLVDEGYDARPVGDAIELVERLTQSRAVVLDVNLGDRPTVCQVFDAIRRTFPGSDIQHERILNELSLGPGAPADGRYLAAAIKNLALGTQIVVLTGLAGDSELAYFSARGVTAIVSKMSEDTAIDRDRANIAGLMGELVEHLGPPSGAGLPLAGDPAPTTAAPYGRVEPTPADDDAGRGGRALEPPADQRDLRAHLRSDASVKDFLAAAVARWRDCHVGAEVLFYNKDSGYLEQIAQVGMSDIRESMYVRSASGASIHEMGLCAYAALHNESVLAPEVRFDRRYRALSAKDTTRSELVIPLALQGQVVAVLNLEFDAPRAFDNADVEHFERLAPALALRVEYETFIAEERFLNKAIQDLLRAKDETEVLRFTLSSILGFVGRRCLGCILVPGDEEQPPRELKVVDASDGFTKVAVGSRLRLGDLGVIRGAVESPSGRHYWTAQDQTPYVPLAESIKSELALVLKMRDQVLAVIDIESRDSVITERYQRAIDRLAQFATALLLSFRALGADHHQRGVQAAVAALNAELHNVRGSIEIVLGELARAEGGPRELESLRREVTERLRNAGKIVASFLTEPYPVPLSHTLSHAVSSARAIGVQFTPNLQHEIHTMATERGVSWILENLLLNSKKHYAGSEAPRAFLVAGSAGEDVTQITYWDNGRAPALDLVMQGDGRGLRDLRWLCGLYRWEHEMSRHADGGLQHTFRFRPCRPAAVS